MVDDFLRKAKDFIGGSKGEERERDSDYREGRGRRVRSSEDRYEEEEEYSGNVRRSRHDDEDEEEEEYSGNVRRSRHDDEDDDD